MKESKLNVYIIKIKNLIIESVVPSFRNIGCLRVLSTSVYQLLGTLVQSRFYPLLYNRSSPAILRSSSLPAP
jgi:hypothetical protein